MTKYDAELRCIVDNYAKKNGEMVTHDERERVCAVAIDVICRNCPVASATPLRSDSEAPASVPPGSCPK